MKFTLISNLCFHFIPGIQGLEMSLDINTSATSGHRPACAVLTCEESVTADSSSTPVHRAISSMKIFKSEHSSATEDNNRPNMDLFVALTSEQPNISSVSDGIKVDGVLEAKQASLRLEMFNKADCSALFSCEMRTADDQGNEFVHVTRLRHLPEQLEGQNGGSSMTSGVMSQQLVLLQQQMTLLGVSLVRKFEDLETRLGGKFEDFETRLGGKFEDLETRLGGKFEDLETRLSGKFVDLETRLGGKLEDLETRLGGKFEDAEIDLDNTHTVLNSVSVQETRSDGKSKVFGGNVGELETLLENRLGSLETRLNAQFGGVEVHLDSNLLGIKNKMQSVQYQIQSKVETTAADMLSHLQANLSASYVNEHALAQRFDKFEENLAEFRREIKATDRKNSSWDQSTINDLIVATENIVNVSEDMSHRVNSEFSLLCKNMYSVFKQLVTRFPNSSNENLFADCDHLVDSKLTIPFELNHGENGISRAKLCTKGVENVPAPNASSYYVVQPSENELCVPFLCDSVTDGGDWIVIQRRTTGHVDFNRTWEDYKQGFGNLDEFWLGNENIHALTKRLRYELRVDLRYNGESRFAHYKYFSLGDEEEDYSLNLGDYDGTAGDGLSFYMGDSFSTYDRDNDVETSTNYAEKFAGAWWWHDSRRYSNLNGQWNLVRDNRAASWNPFSVTDPVTFSEMKIRKW